jgi:hypothetical protein
MEVEERLKKVESDLELHKQRLDYFQATWADGQQQAQQALHDIHITLSGVDKYIRNGMSSKLSSLGTQVRIQWVLFTGVGLVLVLKVIESCIK